MMTGKNWSTLRKSCSSATLSSVNPTSTALGSNQDLCNEKLVANCWTAFLLLEWKFHGTELVITNIQLPEICYLPTDQGHIYWDLQQVQTVKPTFTSCTHCFQAVTINCPRKQHIPDASGLKVLFYHVSHSKFLVLTYDIFEMTVSKKKWQKPIFGMLVKYCHSHLYLRNVATPWSKKVQR